MYQTRGAVLGKRGEAGIGEIAKRGGARNHVRGGGQSPKKYGL